MLRNDEKQSEFNIKSNKYISSYYQSISLIFNSNKLLETEPLNPRKFGKLQTNWQQIMNFYQKYSYFNHLNYKYF